jgi:hypothetical protein
MKILRHIALALLLLTSGNLAAQDMVHKASGVDERSFGKGVRQVSVYGEKASVTVKGWSGSEVKVVLRPVSRNSDREKAVADLKYIQYYAEKEGDRIVIRNSYRGELEKITSNLSIGIEVFMPASVPAEITNLYGPVVISGLTDVAASVSFGSLAITDVSSTCTVTARYSNTELISVRGTLDINSEKSDIRARALSAATAIKCSYGRADLDFAGTGTLTVKGHRTTVEITVDDFGRYGYSLYAPQGRVILPGGRQAGKEKVEIQHPDSAGAIDITTSYCDITITTK